VRSLRARLVLALKRLQRLLARAASEFLADRCPTFAAGISYYALFSLFPLAILLVAGFGLVVDDAEARARVISFVLDNVPLQGGAGEEELRDLLRGVTRSASAFGVVGVAGLLFAASGVMAALRNGLNAAWDTTDQRPLVQGKIVDVLLILGFGLLVALSFAGTLAAQLARSVVGEVRGGLGATLLDLLSGVGALIPAVVALVVFLALYVVLPSRRQRVRDVWPGAVVAALGWELLKRAFAIYLESYSRYDVVYGTLGTIVAFLVFVYLAANIFLFGGELASEWPAVRDAPPESFDEPGQPLGERLRGALFSLFVRRTPPEERERRGRGRERVS
jgi:membrane protein